MIQKIPQSINGSLIFAVMWNNFPEVQITRAHRKSITLKINKNGVLQVRAPRFMLAFQIQNFIKKHSDWIETHYKQYLTQAQEEKYYLYGEVLDVENFQLKEAMITFYKQEAKKYIIPRCRELAQKHGFSYDAIRITSAMTRWGSCSSKKTLNFSYRLVMTPKECIDYVIIHELCHLREMNHSHKFWSEVTAIMPEYKQYEKHLKTFWWKYRV